jgi:hypothetical protein
MENTPGQKYTTSFIPRKAVAVSNTTFVKTGGPNILTIIGLFVFFGAVLASGGVYLWKIQTQRTIDGQIVSLTKARDEFDQNTLKAATRLSERIVAVKSLLDNHKSPSQIFSVLEEKILKNVRLRNLTYTTDVDGTIKIKSSGTASGFEAVVLQSDELGDTGLFKDVLFSEVQTAVQNVVTFSLSASLDPKSVLYRKKLEPQNTAVSQPTQ